MLNRLRTYVLDKLPDLLPLLWAPSLLGVLAVWESYLLQAFDLYIPPVWQLRLLILLLSISLILSTFLFLKRSKYIEYRGAFFKPKKGGGYHEAVYCGKCKTSTSTGNGISADYENFKCSPSCGWVSSFTYSQYRRFINESNNKP